MREYRILADERSAEDLSDLFLEKGALAASLEDADADSTDEAPLYGEPGLEPETCAWPRSIISVLTADDCHFKNLLDDCVKELGCEAPELLSVSDVEIRTGYASRRRSFSLRMSRPGSGLCRHGVNPLWPTP